MTKLIILITTLTIFVTSLQVFSQNETKGIKDKNLNAEITEIEKKEKQNITSILGLLAAFGSGNTDKINSYIHKDFVNHMAPEGLKDRSGFHEIVKNVNASFSLFDSYDVKPEHIFSKGDYVAMMDVGHGVKNGKEFNHTDIHIFKMKDGKLFEHWNSFRLPSQEVKLTKFLKSTEN